MDDTELDYTPDLMTLEDEDGKEHVFEVVDAAEFKDEYYMAVVPYNEDPEKQLQEDATLIFMKSSEDEEGSYVDIVDDDEEFYEVSKMFEKRLRELYDFDI